ncbi:hypothetical protein EMGBS15_10040, partial [Filimonas sp.]
MSDILRYYPTQTLVFPHCIELMEYCVSKQLCHASHHQRVRTYPETKLKNAQLDSYFDKIITSEQAMSMKPKRNF